MEAGAAGFALAAEKGVSNIKPEGAAALTIGTWAGGGTSAGKGKGGNIGAYFGNANGGVMNWDKSIEVRPFGKIQRNSSIVGCADETGICTSCDKCLRMNVLTEAWRSPNPFCRKALTLLRSIKTLCIVSRMNRSHWLTLIVASGLSA